MNILTLPFNATKGTNEAYARQISQYFSNTINEFSDDNVVHLHYMRPVQEGSQIQEFFNPTNELNDIESLKKISAESQANVVIDGLLDVSSEELFTFTLRFLKPDAEPKSINFTSKKDQLFETFIDILQGICKEIEIDTPGILEEGTEIFGTKKTDAFLKFIQGVDVISYIHQTEGNVNPKANFEESYESLLEALKLDNSFEVAYRAIQQFLQDVFKLGIYDINKISQMVKQLIDIRPNDTESYLLLGQMYLMHRNIDKAIENFEEAIKHSPEFPEPYVKLGEAQVMAGMMNNAEKNFKKAYDLDDNEKASADYLAELYKATGRNHEIPDIWKQVIQENPQHTKAHIKLGVSLFQDNKKDKAFEVFDHALATLEDPNPVRKIYAKLFMEEKNFDRAMDLFEDYIDNEPTDPDAMISYAFALQNAGREFEVPPVLNNILQLNIDKDTRAHVQAWHLELIQPKRLEAYTEALQKADEGKYEESIQLLRPLKNWLTDYWKVWALLSDCLIKTKNHDEAEKTVHKLLDMYPGYVDGYGFLTDVYIAKNKAEEAFNLLIQVSSKFQDSIPFAIITVKAANAAGKKDVAKGIYDSLMTATNNNAEIKKALDHVMSPILII